VRRDGFPPDGRSIRLSIEAVDRCLEEAAGTLGANPFWVFIFITFPLIAPGIIAGMILCFAKAMGEFARKISFSGKLPRRQSWSPDSRRKRPEGQVGDA
jgi:molybdate transport system permease protein